jgi:hypothetical protein
MDISPTLALAPQLVEACRALEALLAESASPRDVMTMRMRKRVNVLVADLAAAIEAPQTFRPWTPEKPGNTK